MNNVQHAWTRDPVARYVHIESPRSAPCGTAVMMADEFHGVDPRVIVPETRYRVTIDVQDIETWKYGQHAGLTSWHLTCPRRAYLKYALQIVRQCHAWGLEPSKSEPSP